MTDYKQEIDRIIRENFYDDHEGCDDSCGKKADYTEIINDLTHLIETEKKKDSEEKLQKYLDQMREIMAENFHYRTICGEIKDPSGKLDVNELFIKYQELEPERTKFADYVENRISELQSRGL